MRTGLPVDVACAVANASVPGLMNEAFIDVFNSAAHGRLKISKSDGAVAEFKLGKHQGLISHPSGVDTHVVCAGLGEASMPHGRDSSDLIPEIIGQINDVKFTLKEVPFGSIVAFRRALTIDMEESSYRVFGVGRKGKPVVEHDQGRRLAEVGMRSAHVHRVKTREEALLVVLLAASGLLDVVRNQEWLPRISS